MTAMMKQRILILDDEVGISDLVARIAVTCGYEAKAISEALDFQSHLDAWRPSHIVLDLQMPGVDGIEILRRLAEQRCRADIVIMSGFDEKVIESARHLGRERGLSIVGSIQKPFRTEDVATVLNGLQPIVDVIDEAVLAAAIKQDQLALLFQPKVDLQNRCDVGHAGRYKTTGFEALVRWRHPTRGLLGPAEFLPLAETAGMMSELTEAVIGLAIKQQQAWLAKGIRMSMALNISAQNLREPNFADGFERRCVEAGVPPELIVVELTETAAMDDVTVAMEILTRLRIKGFRLAIDDFGTGYSSLVQLQLLPFSELKIDRAFVRECDTSRQSQIIVKTMIDLARNLGLVSVAEGVETESVLKVMCANGCDMAQGYLISKPLSAEDATQWILREKQHAV